jgi:hypothetical protein
LKSYGAVQALAKRKSESYRSRFRIDGTCHDNTILR